MSEQDQISPAPAARQTASTPSSPPVAAAANADAPTPQPPSRSRHPWSRFAIPLFAVLAAFGFIVLATLRWDAWGGSAVIQTTNDAYVRAELTRLSSRVAGEVLAVAVNDFQRVKAGDLLVQIDPADYRPRSHRRRPASPAHRRRSTISPIRWSCNTPPLRKARRSRCPRPLRRSRHVRSRSGSSH